MTLQRSIGALFLAVAASTAWSQAPLGGEFRVNEFTLGDQKLPAALLQL